MRALIPICLFEEVLLFACFISILLILGETVMFFIEKITRNRSKIKLDIIEIVGLDVALGMALIIIFITILTPFKLFNTLSTYFLVILSLSLLLYNKRLRLEKLKQNLTKKTFRMRVSIRINLHKAIKFILLLVVCSISLYVRFRAVEGLYVFSENDMKAHTFIAFLIVKNSGFVTWEASEYGGVFINYPEGFHGIAAFMSLIMGTSIIKTVTILAVAFTGLLAFALFLVTRSIFNNYWVGILSSLSLFFTYFPSFAWGGITQISGTFPLSIFVMLLFKEDSKTNKILILGILLGCIITVYYGIIFSVISVAISYSFLIFLSGKITKIDILNLFKEIFLIFSIAFCVSAFTLIQVFATYILPPLVEKYIIQEKLAKFIWGLLKTTAGWAYDWSSYSWSGFSDWHKSLTGNALLNLDASRLLDAFSYWYGYWSEIRPQIKSIITISIASLFLSLLLSLFYEKIQIKLKQELFPSLLFIFTWFIILILFEQMNPCGFLPPLLSQYTEKIVFMTTWPFGIFIGYCFFLTIRNTFYFLSSLYKHNLRKRVLSTLLFFLTINIGIIYIFSTTIYWASYNQINRYTHNVKNGALLTLDDIKIMRWVRDFTPTDAVILVSPADGGQYMPVVAQRKVIFPWCANMMFSPSYRYILKVMPHDPESLLLLYYLRRFNVTYVYVGAVDKGYLVAHVSPHAFDPNKILNSNCYSLIKQVGNAYLFKLDILIADSFKSESIVDSSLEDKWNVVRGTWIIKDGFLQSGGLHAMLLVKNVTFKDGVIETSVKNSEGTYVGIVFRATDPKNFYVFVMCPAYSYVSFEKVVKGKSYIIAKKPIMLDPDEIYNLKVVVNGTTFIGYLNGKSVLQANDTLYTTGQIGLITNGLSYFGYFGSFKLINALLTNSQD